MTRVNIIVEGSTEETFANDILSPYLANRGVYIKARSVQTSRHGDRIYRGGMTSYLKAKRDIITWNKEDPNAYLSTMFDLYALPVDFPGVTESDRISDPIEKAQFIQNKIQEDINIPKFIPYIQLHEFEALLFSSPEEIDNCMGLFKENGRLEILNRIKNSYPTPEHINNSPETAPSKRLLSTYDSYDKVFLGSLISGLIGLETIQNNCSHFRSWLNRLLSLNQGL